MVLITHSFTLISPASYHVPGPKQGADHAGRNESQISKPTVQWENKPVGQSFESSLTPNKRNRCERVGLPKGGKGQAMLREAGFSNQGGVGDCTEAASLARQRQHLI